jgi:hypothetical protein
MIEIAALLVLLLLVSNFRCLLKLRIVQIALGGFLKDVGAQALAKQPDTIRLTPQAGHQWQNASAINKLAEPLLARGFTDLGPYSIDVMPQVTLRFLLNATVSVYACIYEHAKAGIWLDLVSRYTDGTGATFTTVRSTGMDQRPQDKIVHAPNASADMLFGRTLVERPQRPLIRLDAAEVIRLFEAVYAEQILWRKTRGISAREVGNVAAAPRV